ncbi:MAG TPA: sodium:proton antiporter [Steroidobacteraceae bacterium]|nr:sodium:proton antiporter [Steroidobacteraceae bacterium]
MGAFWFLLVGFLLVAVALLGRFIDRLPVSLAIIYLLVGFALGPAGVGALELHPMRELELLELVTEIALLIALFTVGIKMRVPIGDWRWSLPLRLATISLVLTIAGIAAAAYWGLGMSAGLALVLGATLAPTDPVLASDVQLRSPNDRDSLRFALTGEGGLNDGTAFPFVFLGLGLLGLHDIGTYGWRWMVFDVAWATIGGLGIGFAIGAGVARGVRALREWRRDAANFDEFLLLGVIGLSYGAALLAHTLGFLAVFAAGLALRRADDIHFGARSKTNQSPLTPSMLSVNEQLERIAEVAVVLLVGAMISTGYWSVKGLVISALLFFVIRPLSVWLGVGGATAGSAPRRLLGWFGIRGIGSAYYALYVAAHDIRYSDAVELLSCVFTVIGASIVVHGVSATPLMDLYQRRRGRGRTAPAPVSDKR